MLKVKLSQALPNPLQLNIECIPGELHALVGPSGSGKTTLLNLIGCIDTPTSGQVFLDGLDVASLSDNARTDLRLYKLGFIFQSNSGDELLNQTPHLNRFKHLEVVGNIFENKKILK